jgi:hypothetical protein
MEYSTEPGSQDPPGLQAQIQLSLAPAQPTAPQEVRSRLIDPATDQEIGHISITIDQHTLEQGPTHRPAIVSAQLEEAYLRRGLSPYLIYNLCHYLLHRYNAEFPHSAEQYSRGSHICAEIDASDGYWETMGGREDYHPHCDLVLTVGEMLEWAQAKLRKATDRKKSGSKVRTTERSKTRRGTPYGRGGGGRGQRKAKSKTKKHRRSRRSRR